jgi:hypothetical protein
MSSPPKTPNGRNVKITAAQYQMWCRNVHPRQSQTPEIQTSDIPTKSTPQNFSTSRDRSATPPVETAHYASPNMMDSSSPFVDDFDDTCKVLDGPNLRGPSAEEKTTEKRLKKRFRITNNSNLTDKQKDQWRILCEVVRPDYVQRGPDQSAQSILGREKNSNSDDSQTMKSIDDRYHSLVLFGPDAPKMLPEQKDYVPS